MCGILGVFQGNDEDKAAFKDILGLSRKRGPDSSGYWENEIVQFGFNRLAILDVSSDGNQPVLSPSQRYVLIFNGEIYNYRELLNRYSISPTALRSTADTEVLAQLLDILPFEKLVAELNGMFAIGVYDRFEKRLKLTRDFAGIKPLFYGVRKGSLFFASQFDQVFSFPSFRGRLSLRPEIMKEYFALGYMQAPNTVFEDIYQCLPGEVLSYDRTGRVQKSRVVEFSYKSRGTVPEMAPRSAQKFSETMRDVLNDQLVSDVPLSSFLSGGIDSPLVCAAASQLKKGLRALTMGTNDHQSNEAEIARQYARHLSVTHDVFYFSESDLLGMLDEHFNSFSEPFGDFSSLPTHMITKKAREISTVMLSGDGGDELFWGYRRFLNVLNHSRWFHYPRGVRKGWAYIMRRVGKNVPYGVGRFDTLGNWVFDQQCHNKDTFLDSFIPEYSYSWELTRMYTIPKDVKTNEELLSWLRWNEFYGHLQRVLIKVDRASMGNSMEVRVPFLDRRMIDYANTIVPALGIQHTEQKWILKRAMELNFPKNLIYTHKRGFEVPLDSWLKIRLKEEVQDALLGTPFYGEGFLNKKVLEDYVLGYFQGKHGYYWGVWILFAWQKWASKYGFIARGL